MLNNKTQLDCQNYMGNMKININVAQSTEILSQTDQKG